MRNKYLEEQPMDNLDGEEAYTNRFLPRHSGDIDADDDGDLEIGDETEGKTYDELKAEYGHGPRHK